MVTISRKTFAQISLLTAALLFSFPVSASAQPRRPAAQEGFFGEEMKSGLLEGMTTKPDDGNQNDLQYQYDLYSGKKKAPPPALVPDIESSNGYSVPDTVTPTPEPTKTPTPSPTPTSTPTPESPSAEYYQRLLEQAKSPSSKESGNGEESGAAAATPSGPPKKQQSYTF